MMPICANWSTVKGQEMINFGNEKVKGQSHEAEDIDLEAYMYSGGILDHLG